MVLNGISVPHVILPFIGSSTLSHLGVIAKVIDILRGAIKLLVSFVVMLSVAVRCALIRHFALLAFQDILLILFHLVISYVRLVHRPAHNVLGLLLTVVIVIQEDNSIVQPVLVIACLVITQQVPHHAILVIHCWDHALNVITIQHACNVGQITSSS